MEVDMNIPVTLNVKSANVIPVINCMQGDTPTLICTIMNGNVPFIADSREFDLCVCEGETAKHKIVSIKCTADKNIVTVHLSKNETDEAGDLKFCISFSNTAQQIVISTFPFILKATENPAYSAVGQKENIKVLTDYVAEAKKYADVAKNSSENISEYVDNARRYSESASASATATEAAKNMSKSYAVGQSGAREGEETDNSKYYSEKSAESEQVALEASEIARQRADEALSSKTNAAASAESAAQSAKNADMDAKLSQSYSVGKSGIRDGEDTDNAKYYYELSKTNADTAVQSATNAANSESNAKSYMESAKQSENTAVQSAESATSSAETAIEKASGAAESATNAKQSETNIKNVEDICTLMSKTARSYTVGDTDFRENEATDNAKYYSGKAKEYAEQAQAVAGGDFISNTEKGIAGGVAILNDALAVEKAVADKNGNDISEIYAEKTEVPTLIKVDGKTIIKDEDGTLHGSVDVDTELSSSSTNPVQNKAVKKVLDGKVDNSATGVSEAINKLSEGTSTPADNDYYIAQYADGGTTTKTYHRRPVSALWEYIKNKIGTVLGLTKNSYTGNAATATNASKVNGHSVNSDVPSNAKFTDTWRGIQNNLNSDSTSDSLSAAQGKALKNLVDGKFNTSGGTMTGDLRFSDIGDTATSKGICWAGSTDGASIFYRTDAKDAGRLVLNLTDDANTRIDFALNGTTKSYIDANGNFSGSAAKVNGHSVNSDVPSNAKFTDTNTWRPVVNNLVTTATGSSLDAAQGKVLNDKITAINSTLSKGLNRNYKTVVSPMTSDGPGSYIHSNLPNINMDGTILLCRILDSQHCQYAVMDAGDFFSLPIFRDTSLYGWRIIIDIQNHYVSLYYDAAKNQIAIYSSLANVQVGVWCMNWKA